MLRLGRDGPYEWKYLAGNIGLRDIMLQVPLVLYLPELQYMGLFGFWLKEGSSLLGGGRIWSRVRRGQVWWRENSSVPAQSLTFDARRLRDGS